MAKGITRRQVLKNLGALSGAAVLAPQLLGGCDGPPGDDGPTGITHVVVVMMENRSYDHWLGARKLVEGLKGDGLVEGMTNPDLGGTQHPIYPMDVDCVVDPPHGWDPGRVQLNAGACDGFMRAYQESKGVDIGPQVMGYMQRAAIPVSWALADQYTSCDRWFSSLLGPTWPNRFYLHSAQSNGRKNNEYPGPEGFLWPTIYERLNDKGVAWNYYYSDLPFIAFFKNLDPERMRRMEEFFEDAEKGTLPPYTVVEPGFTLNDDHPPHHPMMGQMFLSSIYTALAKSPLWKNCLLVITYDEWGGFHDHVPPPSGVPDDYADQGFDQLGFRVPTILAGPYVKKNHVSSVQYDHTSVLRHIEKMWDLEPLTARDAAANDLSDCLDQERLAAGQPEAPITLPMAFVDEATLDDSCYGKDVLGEPSSDLEAFANAGGIPAHLDLRSSMRERARVIARVLEREGLGGFRST